MLFNEDDPLVRLVLENDLWLLSLDEIRKANVAHVTGLASRAVALLFAFFMRPFCIKACTELHLTPGTLWYF